MRAPHGLVAVAVVVTAGLGLALLVAAPSAANTSGDTITPVNAPAKGLRDRLAAKVVAPTDIAFTPDGRGLITTDGGRLRVLRPGGIVPGAAVNLTRRICSGGERGLLGVTVDPAFETNRWIYLYWTFDKNDFCGVGTDQTPVNRVTRYHLRANDTAAPGSARVIVDSIPSPATNHNAGDLEFGADGMLYITTGDGGCEIGATDQCGAANDNARRLDVPLGKVLRVKPTGRVPVDNPYADAVEARRCTAPGGPDPGTGPCAETFASGFRNPFRMDIRAGTSTPWVNDVGQDAWEEIDKVTSGGDYGWNVREGFCATGSTVDCDPAGYVDPQFAYDHATDCRSITGGAFVPKGTWGGRFAGEYLFADFVCGSIWRLDRAPDTSFVAKPLVPATNPVALTFGPSQQGRALYYAEYVSGEIRRITAS